MNKKLLIVSMGLPYNYKIEKAQVYGAFAPYGPLSIASYVNELSVKNSKVSVLDICESNFNELECLEAIEEKVKIENPEIIGFSIMFNTSQTYTGYLADKLKLKMPNVIIIAGGPIATNFYEFLLKENKNLDAICFSEGEIPILQIMDEEDTMNAIENNESFITRASLEKNIKPKAQFVYNLDEIPFIDYSLIDLSRYSSSSNSPYGDDEDMPENPRELWIHTSRGCPLNCVFCAANSVHGKKMRYMSADRVIENTKDMIEKYNLTHLTIVDDQFLIDTKRAKDALLKLSQIEPSIDVVFSIVSVFLLDDEIASLVKKLNCKRFAIAVESGSQYVLDNLMGKPVNLVKAKETIKMLKSHDLYVQSAFVIGLPGETDEHREETLSFIRESDLDWSDFFVAAPIKGSRLYDICVENNYIDMSAVMNMNIFKSEINTPFYSSEYITEKAYLMNLEVNFVSSNFFKNKNYESGLKVFKRVAKHHPDHAFSYYCIAKVYKELGDMAMFEENIKIFNDIVEKNEMWNKYAKHFNLISNE